MQALLQSIMTRIAGSALNTAVGGRVYLDEAPEGAAYPNVVFMVPVSTPADTFTESIEDTLVQFSLRSLSDGATEITSLYANLKALFDDVILSVNGGTNVQTQRQSLTTIMEDVTTPAGTVGCRAWHVDYSIMVQS